MKWFTIALAAASGASIRPTHCLPNQHVHAALIDLGCFDEAVAAARKAVLMNQRHAVAYRYLAVALAHLGREAEASETVAGLLELEPNFRISEWTAGRWQSEVSIEGLRKAGFPE